MIPSFLLPPQWLAAERAAQKRFEEERRKFYKLARKSPTIWDGMKTKLEPRMVLDAQSWVDDTKPYWPFPDDPVIDRRKVKDWRKKLDTDRAIKVGEDCEGSPHWWLYRHQLLPAGEWISITNGKRQKGIVAFTDDVVVPTVLSKRDWVSWSPDYGMEVWMSFTPMELLTQRGAIRFSRGDVLVGGLGLGWVARKIAEKKSVTRVVVVEKHQALIDLMKPTLPRGIELVCGDVRKYLEEHGQSFDKLVLDIWPGFGDSREDWELAKVFSRYPGLRKKAWCWGGLPERW